jgi:rare lipoprotein A (peptidoglycan hydrolase)
MFTRASRAFPGMAVAALVVGLAFAGPAAATDLTPSNSTLEVRKSVVKARAARPARPAPSEPATATPEAMAPADDAVTRSDSTMAAIWRQTGMASWYGGQRWQGNRTASGARYDQAKLTAAHATLPIGTRVRVTLEGTDRSVIVLINDRPGTRRRIIDLSRSAAAELGILSQGIAVVTLSAL